MINLVETTQGATNQPSVSVINGVFFNDFNKIRSVNNKNRTWVATIRSNLNNRWTGSMSVLDKQINNIYTPRDKGPKIAL